MDECDIKVEVVYARPEIQVLVEVVVKRNATVLDAIIKSGIPGRFPEIDVSTAKTGIFGNLVPLDTGLRHKDRVEIYRPLLVDPKEARRLRARKG
ncbi:MAG: RnfH family protein [Pseudomonadales bacterium]